MAKDDIRLDEIDYKILKAIGRNARLSYRVLAKKIGVSASTIFLRINKLVREGVIRGFVSLIDMEKLGWDINVAICLKVKGGHLEKVEGEIAKVPNVCAVYDITGDWDSLVIAKFRTRKDLNRFVKSISSIPYVEHTCTYTVLNSVKEEIFSELP